MGGGLRHNIRRAYEALRKRCRAPTADGPRSTKAILSLPNGPKLKAFEDVGYVDDKRPLDACFSDSDSPSDPGTESCSSSSDSDELSDSDAPPSDGDAQPDNPDHASTNSDGEAVEFVRAKADRGVWGLGHVIEGKLFFTRDIVDTSILRAEYKLTRPQPTPPAPKRAPKPAPKPAPKKATRGKKQKHVQLFKMRRTRKRDNSL